MKLLLEILISVFLHPLAFLLALVNIVGRDDLTGGQKLIWAVICVVWGIGPILYVLIGDGALW
jgi:Phospholipase_D-nuclease N-terminal